MKNGYCYFETVSYRYGYRLRRRLPLPVYGFFAAKNSGGVIWPQQIKAEEAAECLRFCGGGAVSCAAVNAYVQSLYRGSKKSI